MLIVLHPEQEAEVRQIAADLELPIEHVVAHLLSGPLHRDWDPNHIVTDEWSLSPL
jgi:hypothetical protein